MFVFPTHKMAHIFIRDTCNWFLCKLKISYPNIVCVLQRSKQLFIHGHQVSLEKITCSLTIVMVCEKENTARCTFYHSKSACPLQQHLSALLTEKISQIFQFQTTCNLCHHERWHLNTEWQANWAGKGSRRFIREIVKQKPPKTNRPEHEALKYNLINLFYRCQNIQRHQITLMRVDGGCLGGGGGVQGCEGVAHIVSLFISDNIWRRSTDRFDFWMGGIYLHGNKV